MSTDKWCLWIPQGKYKHINGIYEQDVQRRVALEAGRCLRKAKSDQAWPFYKAIYFMALRTTH